MGVLELCQNSYTSSSRAKENIWACCPNPTVGGLGCTSTVYIPCIQRIYFEFTLMQVAPLLNASSATPMLKTWPGKVDSRAGHGNTKQVQGIGADGAQIVQKSHENIVGEC